MHNDEWDAIPLHELNLRVGNMMGQLWLPLQLSPLAGTTRRGRNKGVLRSPTGRGGATPPVHRKKIHWHVAHGDSGKWANVTLHRYATKL
mmetsp:Transcript_68105/g.134400  ORF Transcript_68105/g.134400 Transcript_68105/m.134400 type:complete len:90 (+) Transcript_68105:1817-2086(+)